MTTSVSATVARQTLPAQLDRVEAGEQVEITRHGKVVAVLVSPDQVRIRRTSKVWERADEIGRQLEEARNRPLDEVGLLGAERAEELVREVYAGRAE
ncbi:prevent-host-death family protein [Branchiibius hedensis]|uniref:Antitoxin n=1 Tax=Branchiibius hedensis TaxID=672460 RepID=A0A2Y8ZUB3_9MICO|nr:type II toxin-antitoxin system prevent-host-death family antitoxin [Branchiibius hedensis]PWJ24620.1 prevent-host-death family protein [Branchiibius hedensis]SSA33437.1 prevent-host-death family protein [Branchiibius hedensis]